jgi:hypothetical protein
VQTKAKIENLKSTTISDKIEVSFSISNTSKNEKLTLELQFKIGDRLIVPKSISGSLELLPAGNHKIIWDVLQDLDELEGAVVPILNIIESNVKMKPQNAFVPGFNSRSKILATISYACVLTGAYQYYNYSNNYDKYKNETDDPILRQDYYDKSVAAKNQSAIFVGAGVGLLATNFLLSKLYNKKYNLAYINYQKGGICLTYIRTIKF